MENNPVINGLLGVAMGDALGVPFEFKRSYTMKANPATDMVGYGTYNLPAGTWSDDTSLTLCLAESLVSGYDLVDMSKKFMAWRYENYWTARGKLFDIGMTTSRAINRLKEYIDQNDYEAISTQKWAGNERENGNGSLMRILPLLFYIKGKGLKEQFDIVWDVSALTHRHIRAAMSCMIYLRLAEYLLNGEEKIAAYTKMQEDILTLWNEINFAEEEQIHFAYCIAQDIRKVAREDLKSGGYVIEALEASLWCFLQENSYKDAVLSVINLGHDTDTTAAITGGLAGLYYGVDAVPERWHKVLARRDDIITLANQLYEKYF